MKTLKLKKPPRQLNLITILTLLALQCAACLASKAAALTSSADDSPVRLSNLKPADNGNLESIQREVQALREKVNHPKKDTWDKLSSLSPLFTGGFVALIGLWATTSYNRHQSRIQSSQKERELDFLKVQTIEKFFTHLSSDDKRVREAALLATSTLVNEEFSTRLAVAFGGPAARSVLAKFAGSPDPAVARLAQAGISKLRSFLDEIEESVVQVIARYGERWQSCTGFFIFDMGTIAVVGGKLDLESAEEVKVSLDSRLQQKIGRGHIQAAVLLKTISHPIVLQILQVSIGERNATLPMTSAQNYRGQRVFMISRPSDLSMPTMIAGYIKGVGGYIEGTNRQFLEMSHAGFRKDCEGSPVIDEDAALVGVVSSQEQHSNDEFHTSQLVPIDIVLYTIREAVSLET